MSVSFGQVRSRWRGRSTDRVLLYAAMLAYEYVITLDQEVNLFWRRKKNGATVLFLLARYLALLSYVVLGGATFAPMSDNVSSSSLSVLHCT